MSNMCEIRVDILNSDYKDELMVCLLNQGYQVYYNADDSCVCYLAPREDIRIIENCDVKAIEQKIANEKLKEESKED